MLIFKIAHFLDLKKTWILSFFQNQLFCLLMLFKLSYVVVLNLHFFLLEVWN